MNYHTLIFVGLNMNFNRGKQEVSIISDESHAFFYRSVVNSLEREGYEVIELAPSIRSLSELSAETGAIFIFASDEILKDKEIFVYLKDWCIENEKQLAIIGYEEQIKNICASLPSEIVWDKFQRPLNIENLLAKLENHIYLGYVHDQKKHILVVDDSGASLRMTNEWLRDDYNVTMANSAALAFQALSNQKIDLILLDIEMPICSGPQFLQMLRAEVSTADIPVIFLTSKNDIDNVRSVLDLKPSGYLLKTQTRDEILNFIDDFFERNKTRYLDV